jgi:hypothetical protein
MTRDHALNIELQWAISHQDKDAFRIEVDRGIRLLQADSLATKTSLKPA